MKVIRAYPPLIDAIDAAFNVRGKPILFAWADTIYNPAGVAIPAELIVHECVHCERQLALAGGVEAWWARYIAEPAFRLQEELPAHVAEYKSLCAQHSARWTSQRAMRRTIAAHVARKLCAPLYGSVIKFEDAKKQLLAA